MMSCTERPASRAVDAAPRLNECPEKLVGSNLASRSRQCRRSITQVWLKGRAKRENKGSEGFPGNRDTSNRSAQMESPVAASTITAEIGSF